MAARAPLIKSTIGKVIAALVIIGGGLWLWDHRGQPGPRRHNLAPALVTCLAALSFLTACLPFSAAPRRRALAFALCLPLAAALAWGAFSLQRSTHANLGFILTAGAMLLLLAGIPALVGYLERRAERAKRLE